MDELGQDDEVEAGMLYKLPVTLSGTAAVYPVTIAYQLVGAVSGSDPGELVIEGGMAGAIEFSILYTALAGDNVTLILTSANNAVIADDNALVLTVIDVNLSPIVAV